MVFRKIIGALGAILLLAAMAVPRQAIAQDTFGASGQIVNSATANANLAVPLISAQSAIGFNVAGLTASGATLTIEGSADGRAITNSSKVWATTGGLALPGGSTTPFTTLNADQTFRASVSGLDAIRLRVSSTGSGNITIGYRVIYGAPL